MCGMTIQTNTYSSTKGYCLDTLSQKSHPEHLFLFSVELAVCVDDTALWTTRPSQTFARDAKPGGQSTEVQRSFFLGLVGGRGICEVVEGTIYDGNVKRRNHGVSD